MGQLSACPSVATEPMRPLVDATEFMRGSSAAVRERVHASGLSPRALAAAARVSQKTVLGVERGDHVYRLPVYLRLAEALGCTVDDLMGLS